jgi:hypothetical protein
LQPRGRYCYSCLGRSRIQISVLRVSSLWPSSVCPENTGISLKLEHGRFLTHAFQFNTVTVSDSNFLNAKSFCAVAHGMDTTWNSAIGCLCDSVYKGRHVHMAFACILRIAGDASFEYAERCVFCITAYGRTAISLRSYYMTLNTEEIIWFQRMII